MSLEKRFSEEDGSNLSFEKKSKKDFVFYAFNHVGVAIDSTGKNQKDLPELLFGTFDTKADIDSSALSQPEFRREGVDMEYIASCILEAAKDSGINEFWLYPYGEDKSKGKEIREQARLRLFKRYADITPAKNGFGYVVKV